MEYAERQMKLCAVQFKSSDDPYENLVRVQALTEEAQQAGATLVCFPENIFYRGARHGKSGFSRDEATLELDATRCLLENSDFSKAVGEWIRNLNVSVSLGSVLQKSSESSLPYNAHWLIHAGSPPRITTYAKIHLFDYSGSAGRYHESKDVSAGSSVVVSKVQDILVGLSICYDLRFPELYRAMTLNMGAQLLLIPAAFTQETGKAHWHTLLKSRAIENLSFVVAAGQWGFHEDSKGQRLECFGHSCIVDPWGNIVAEAPEQGDGLLFAELSPKHIQNFREKLPSLQNARFWESI